MKLTLNRFSLLAINAQKYTALAMMAYAIIAIVIGARPPEGGGDTGL